MYGHGLLDEAIEQQAAGLGCSAVEAEREFIEIVRQMAGGDGSLVGS